MGKIWLKMKGFAQTTRDITDLHRFLVNHGTHEKHGKGNLTVAGERRYN